MRKFEVLGVRIDDLDYKGAVEQVRSWWREGGKHYIVTPNPEMIMYADGHDDHKKVLNESDMSVPDGIGIVWASFVLGKNLKGRVTGTDLAEKLVEEASRYGESVFFLGGHYGVARESAKRFLKRFPNLMVAGWSEGDSSTSGDIETRGFLRNKKIGLLLVAYGYPGQEYWIARNLVYLDVKVAMGIGGAFDFWAGRSTRAPIWVRRMGLEWIYRLIREPWRLKRQLAIPLFMVKVLGQIVRVC
jgi:N-acetylglucosaminyldiphosphoundecaprenol N-acetyl-beta-D-mannosaminyltransferase